MSLDILNPLKNQKGFSLVSVLVAAGALGGLVVTGNSVLIQNMNAAKNIENRNDIQQLRLSLLNEVDCRKTLGLNEKGEMPASSCKANQLVPLVNSRGEPITTQMGTGKFANSYRMSGNWFVKASCQSGSLEVRVAMQGSGDNYGRDTLRDQELNFNNPSLNPIFGSQTIEICRAALINAPKDDVTDCNTQPQGPMLLQDIMSDRKRICNFVTNLNLANDAVRRNSIDTLTLLGEDFAVEAINTSKLTGLFQEAQFAADQIKSAHFVRRSVTGDRIFQDNVLGSKIDGSQILTAHLYKDGNSKHDITSDKIADGEVKLADVNNATLKTEDFAAGAVKAVDLVNNNAVTTRHFANNSVNSNEVSDRAMLREVSFASNNLRAEDLVSIAPIDIAGKSIRSHHIEENAIVGSSIAEDAINAGNTNRLIPDDGVQLTKMSASPWEGAAACAHDSVLIWDGAKLTCGPFAQKIESAIAYAEFTHNGDYQYKATVGTVVGPADAWTNGAGQQLLQTHQADRFERFSCDSTKGWRMVSCWITDSIVFDGQVGELIDDDDITYWFMFDRDTTIEGNTCRSNDVWEMFSGGQPHGLKTPADFVQRIYASCIRVQ